MTTLSAPRLERQRVAAAEIALAVATFLLVALLVWWQVWTSHPTSVTTCGCGDAARFIWYFEWPAFALAHGHSPLWSAWMLHPTGVNLLNDTSVLGLGLVLAPLTWLLGPVASMNVALGVAPMLSATTCFVLVRRFGGARWSSWLAGLIFGFSPFVLTELALNQINIAFLGLLPLMVVVLDELLVVQRHRPRTAGLVLAALVVVQFFIGIEVLVIVALTGVVALIAILLSTARLEPAARERRLRHGVLGLGWAVGASAVVLAYPLWFYFRGPAHLSGPVWGGAALASYGLVPRSFVDPAGLATLEVSMKNFGGYQGPVLPGLGYLGVGLLLLSVLCSICGWRRPVVRLATLLALVAAALSLRPGGHVPVPWSLLRHLPILSDVVELRFLVVVTLCAAVVIGLGVTDFAALVERNIAGWFGRALVFVLVVLALVPTAMAMLDNIPLTARPVVLPTWFHSSEATTSSPKVLLTYPFPSSGLQSSLAWQAVDAMAWAQAGGGGPAGVPARAGDHQRAALVLDEGSLGLGPLPAISTRNVTSVRSALDAWGVTTIVVPLDRDLPVYERGRSRAWAVAFLTAVEGTAPRLEHTAMVWQVSPTTTSSRLPTAATLACEASPLAQVPSCVLRSLTG